jgi:hypothetical protein
MVRLSALLLVSLTLPKMVAACTCIPRIPGKEEQQIRSSLEKADIVFRGEIVTHRWHAAVFRVDEQWKGNLKSQVKLEWRRGDRGDCNGFWPNSLKVGNKLTSSPIRVVSECIGRAFANLQA